METIKTPLFIFCSFLFLAHQVTQHLLKIHLPWIDSHLDNLVAMPIVLSLLLAERRLLFKKPAGYRLSRFEIVVATIYISLVSEWLFPLLSKRFTADLPDYFYFFAGAFLFALVGQQGRGTITHKAGSG